MTYIVPKFIDREPKIFGPLSWRQFMFFLIGIGVAVILFFVWGKKNVVLFLLIVIFLAVVFFFLSFGSVGGRPSHIFLKNFFIYIISQKLYVFRRKVFTPETFSVSKKISQKLPIKGVGVEKVPAGDNEESREKKMSLLQKLSTQLITKSKK